MCIRREGSVLLARSKLCDSSGSNELFLNEGGVVFWWMGSALVLEKMATVAGVP